MGLAGVVLAEALGIYEGKKVVFTQAYGPEARGGASFSDVVASDEEIDYPSVLRPDAMLILSQQAADKHASLIKEDGVIVYDTEWVEQLPQLPETVTLIPLRLTDIARKEAGMALSANMAGLGALSAATGIVSLEALEKAIRARVKKGTEEANVKAARAGYWAAKNWLEKSLHAAAGGK